MDIQVSGKGLELSTAFRNEVTMRVESALERFRERITRVRVFVEDVNGPKRGVDKCLRLVIHVSRIPEVVVEKKGESWRAIMDETIQRAAQSLNRQIGRLRACKRRTLLCEHSIDGNFFEDSNSRI